MGLPDNVEYRMSVTQIPGSTLTLEFLELKGIGRAVVRARVQDPGGYRLQLQVEDIDSTLSVLRNAGSRVLSTSGAPVRMVFERPWRLAIVDGPANVFMVLRQGPLAQ